ncbi:hypothetical protein L6R46_08125 [Myxococcota bacterium]|nr:hypothetical protein [Myxococcota bacterium]
MLSPDEASLIAAERRAALRFAGFVGLAVLVLGVAMFGGVGRLTRLVKYELPRLTMTEEQLQMERLHAELWPDLAIALRGDAREAKAALLGAIEGDGALWAIGAEIVDLAEQTPGRNAEAIVELCDRWTATLHARGEPWILECNVMSGRSGSFFYTKSYEVLNDLTVTVSGEATRARLIRRADSTNVVEQYLGHSGDLERGAMIVTDRIADSALTLWASLDGADPYSAPLQAELARALGPEALATLTETAPHRRQLQDAADSINQRRSCSNFVVQSVPALGYERYDLEAFEQRGLRDGGACPEVRHEESQAILAASRALSGEDALPEALNALAAHLARGVMVHEARHQADERAGLPEALLNLHHESVLKEARSYLASFAHPELGWTSLAQACQGAAGGGGPHDTALGWLRDEGLGELCQSPSPELPTIAGRIEAELFGAASVVEVPALARLEVDWEG